MYEMANKLRDREDNTRQKDEVYNELKSEWNTLRENCIQHEGKQFTVPEILERSERLNKEKDGEINPFIVEVPAEKICINEATTLGAVAVGVDANISKSELIKVEGVDPVDDVNFLEIGGYVAQELVEDVAVGDNLSLMQSTGIT